MGTDSMSGSDDTCLRKLSETVSNVCFRGQEHVQRSFRGSGCHPGEK